MAFPNDNRIILALGAVLAVVAAVVIALIFMGRGGDDEPTTPEERAGLQLDVTEAPDLEPTRELRCFVDGRFVGMATLADCARQNGVATEGLDVGLDETGALAAAPTAQFAPPPEEPPLELTEAQPITPPEVSPVGPAPQPVQAGAPCLRHVGGEWRQLSAGMSQGAVSRPCSRALRASRRRPVRPLGRPDPAAGAAPGGAVPGQQPLPHPGRAGPQLSVPGASLMRPLLLSAALMGLTLAACSTSTEAPFDQGVCYHVVEEGEEVRFTSWPRMWNPSSSAPRGWRRCG
ncbi:hypothetical protein [Brevundimonas denitrificans]|uniref:hypothetical protein n=1 Tax=Brevundimonas denitrificans TaxID=1443434 RepID=UPI00223BA783|nr:hypothetical protein [Brevundimonas denitrificans]